MDPSRDNDDREHDSREIISCVPSPTPMWTYIQEKFEAILHHTASSTSGVRNPIINNFTSTFHTLCAILADFDLRSQINAPDLLFSFIYEIARFSYIFVNRVRVALTSQPTSSPEEHWHSFTHLSDDAMFCRVIWQANQWTEIEGIGGLQNLISVSVIRSFK